MRRPSGLHPPQAHDLHHLADPGPLLIQRQVREAIGNVLGNVQVGEQGIVLGNVAHPARARRHVDAGRRVEQDAAVEDDMALDGAV